MVRRPCCSRTGITGCPSCRRSEFSGGTRTALSAFLHPQHSTSFCSRPAMDYHDAMLHRWLIFLAVLAGCAATDSRVAPAPVGAAERAFAADGAKRGWAAAFRSYAAPEAIMLNPDPVNAHESLAKVQGDGETTLDWRPAYAGISRTRGFGFSRGPLLLSG